LAQDDYYYEIQLTNKQLIFYFMAGAAGLILSFLAGVMVGRGVEGGNVAAAGGDQATRVVEEKVVPEQTPTPTDYTYPQRLESEKATEGLERPATVAGAAPSRPAAAAAPPVAKPTPAARPTTAARPTPTPAVALPPPPTRAPAAAATAGPAPPSAAATSAAGLPKALGPTAKGFAVQVGAFKDRGAAEAIVKSLKARGLPAFSVPPAAHSGGLYTVRVGAYRDRADADVVAEHLRGEKFQPYVIKQ
jgi:cell division septation protein DedD